MATKENSATTGSPGLSTSDGPAAVCNDVEFIDAGSLVESYAEKGLASSVYVGLWGSSDRQSIGHSIQDPKEYQRLKRRVKEVFAFLDARSIHPAGICVGSHLLGGKCWESREFRWWLRNMVRDIHRIANRPIAVSHQAGGWDELESIARMDEIGFLDVTHCGQAEGSAVKAFRAVCRAIPEGKPVGFCIQRSAPPDERKRSLWKDRVRRLLWSGFSGGAAFVAGSGDSVVGELRRAKAMLKTFLGKFTSWQSNGYSPDLLRSGRYHVRNMGNGEYFLHGPYGGKLTLDCSKLRHPILLRWYNPGDGSFFRNDISLWKRDLALKAPFPGDAAIFMKERSGIDEGGTETAGKEKSIPKPE